MVGLQAQEAHGGMLANKKREQLILLPDHFYSDGDVVDAVQSTEPNVFLWNSRCREGCLPALHAAHNLHKT